MARSHRDRRTCRSARAAPRSPPAHGGSPAPSAPCRSPARPAARSGRPRRQPVPLPGLPRSSDDTATRSNSPDARAWAIECAISGLPASSRTFLPGTPFEPPRAQIVQSRFMPIASCLSTHRRSRAARLDRGDRAQARRGRRRASRHPRGLLAEHRHMLRAVGVVAIDLESAHVSPFSLSHPADTSARQRRVRRHDVTRRRPGRSR